MGKVKLGDIAVLINGDRGKNYPSQKEIITSGGIPFVNAGHLNGRAIEFEAMNYITPEKYEKLNSGKFQQNDILYCLRGSLGKKALINDNIYGAIASSLVIIRPNLEKVRPQYLMLALETPLIKEQLFKFNNGSSQPNLSAKSVKEYKLEFCKERRMEKLKYTRVEECCEILDSMRIPITASDRKEGKYPYYGANGIQDYVNDYIFDDELVLLAEDGGNFGSKEKPIAYRVSGKCWVNNHAHVLKPKEEIDVDYLCYSLMFYKVDGMINGATRKKLTQTAMKKMKIPLRNIVEQKKIVQQLNKIIEIREKAKKELNLLDNLIQARFVEMFGDPITNSKLLPIEKIEERYFLKAGITTKAEDIHDYLKDKYEIPCYGGNGIRGYVENLSYEGCYPIIGRQGALCGNVQYATGKFHATEHAVLVSTLKNDNTMWVYYMLKLMDLYRYHTGAAQPGLAVKKLNTIDVIVADINLQNQFAAFVHQINKSKFVIHKFLYCTTHNTKSIIKPRPNTKESGKIRGRETTCRRILTF